MVSRGKDLKISKFPITLPDGTKYRIKIEEMEGFITDYIEASLYLPRKRFGYKLVFRNNYKNSVGNTDYIALANEVVNDYYCEIECKAELSRKREQDIIRKNNAIERFHKWDGILIEEETK